MLLTTQKLKCLYGFRPLQIPFGSNLSRLNCEKRGKLGARGLMVGEKLYTHTALQLEERGDKPGL